MNQVAQSLTTNAAPTKRDSRRDKRVLILGNDDRVLLAIIRSLGRQGISVHVAWSDPGLSAIRSRYLTQVHAIPEYSPDSDEWLKALNRLVKQTDFDVVIPCNDFAVIPLQTNRDRLDGSTLWYLINDEAFNIAFDKVRTSRTANELGIPMPSEVLIDGEQAIRMSGTSEILELNGQPIQFPVYVKPRSSITEDDVQNKRVVQKIDTATDLSEVIAQSNEAGGFLIQESFVGEGVGVEVLASEGSVVLELQHRRLRETIDGGSTYRETTARNRELSNAVCKFVKRLNLSGVAMFEFRVCTLSERWVLLEINARFWGSLPLAISAGMDFPFRLYEMLVYGKKEFSGRYRPGVRCRNLVADLRATRKAKKMGSAMPSFQWSRLLVGRDHLDHFAVDDWRPQMHSLWQFGTSFIGKVFRRGV